MPSGLNYSRALWPSFQNASLFNKVLNPRTSIPALWLADLTALFVPRRCAGCDGTLLRFEECLCTTCLADLPFTRFHDDPANRVEQLFWGKASLAAASALLQFSATGMVQRILHRMKYRQDLETGRYMGRLMGEALKSCPRFSHVDAVIAVPLHPRKQRQRGYNQSRLLVEGILEVWPKEDPHKALQRTAFTASQTKRGRMDRWTNVKEAFAVKDIDVLRDRHVLLVDDVVTTGATIEGCVKALSTIPGTRVSLFTVACA